MPGLYLFKILLTFVNEYSNFYSTQMVIMASMHSTLIILGYNLKCDKHCYQSHTVYLWKLSVLSFFLCLRFVAFAKRGCNTIMWKSHGSIMISNTANMVVGYRFNQIVQASSSLRAEHRASTVCLQTTQSRLFLLASLLVMSNFSSSSMIVQCHKLLGLPLRLTPWWFQSSTCLVVLDSGFLSVCTIHFHFFLFMVVATSFCSIILHSSSLLIFFGHQMPAK